MQILKIILIKRLNKKKHGALELKDIKDKLKKYDNNNLHIKKVKEKFNLSKNKNSSIIKNTVLEELDNIQLKEQYLVMIQIIQVKEFIIEDQLFIIKFLCIVLEVL